MAQIEQHFVLFRSLLQDPAAAQTHQNAKRDLFRSEPGYQKECFFAHAFSDQKFHRLCLIHRRKNLKIHIVQVLIERIILQIIIIILQDFFS